MRRAPKLLVLAPCLFAAAMTITSLASAGGFDVRGGYHADANAVAFNDFSVEPERYVPSDEGETCLMSSMKLVEDPSSALTGSSYLVLDNAEYDGISSFEDCSDRFVVTVPPAAGSYRASLWARHGSLSANLVVSYPEEAGLAPQYAWLAPTGRTTSDGWVEYASNEVSVDGAAAPLVYMRMYGYAKRAGVDIDAFELVRSGTFYPERACAGVRDPVCGPEGLCVDERGQLGRTGVPPLPRDEIRDAMVDTLESRLEIFFGGRKSRLSDLPVALATMEQMRVAETAWEFWSLYGLAGRQLQDWHSTFFAAAFGSEPVHRLNACFIEGDADLTNDVFPSHPVFKDVLVSHVGVGTTVLRQGDRLLAIDGLHPIEWARSLIDVNWQYHSANDDTVSSELVEDLGGPQRRGPSIVRFAKTITVLRCEGDGTCSGVPETIAITDLPTSGEDPNVSCDNRPVYNLEDGANPDPATHRVRFDFFRGRVANTTDQEGIYGMIFDTLYGGGDPNGYVNSNINQAVADWKATARGVIIDHRAGNGGTIDAPTNVTKLVRPPMVIAVSLQPIISAGFTGPETQEEGIALYDQFLAIDPYPVGDDDYDPDLPVALLTHRDGSASDYLPLGMKGAPKTRIFGHAPTAGAFSTFLDFAYYGGVSFSLATGDTITYEGDALIGHGVVPDEIVLQKQSDLVMGVDTLHEAALAWVRQELKP